MSLFNILLTLLIFSILVIVHEAGHFAVAKLSGVLVQEFSIGMGPILFSKTIGETMYSVRAFPMGGFCKMLSSDEDPNNKRAFEKINVFKRIAIVFTGPLMNFVYAFIAILIITISANGIIFPIVSDTVEGSNAQAQGIKIGDRFLKIDNQTISTYQDLNLVMAGCNGNDISVLVEHSDGVKEKLTITPVSDETKTRWIIGFRPEIKTGLFAETVDGYEKVTFGEVAAESFNTMVFYVRSVVVGFVRLFTLKISPNEISGPIGIVKVVGETVETQIQYSALTVVKTLLSLSALLSVNLGVINLFPIPAMDGGRLVFLIIEAIRGKAVDPEKEGFVHYIGFILLIVFMFVVASNDIFKLFRG